MNTEHSAEKDTGLSRDTLAGIVEDVLTENMSLGTSGRWIADWATSPANLADEVARRVYPPGDDQ